MTLSEFLTLKPITSKYFFPTQRLQHDNGENTLKTEYIVISRDEKCDQFTEMLDTKNPRMNSRVATWSWSRSSKFTLISPILVINIAHIIADQLPSLILKQAFLNRFADDFSFLATQEYLSLMLTEAKTMLVKHIVETLPETNANLFAPEIQSILTN
jgi:hypothetical protein